MLRELSLSLCLIQGLLMKHAGEASVSETLSGYRGATSGVNESLIPRFTCVIDRSVATCHIVCLVKAFIRRIRVVTVCFSSRTSFVICSGITIVLPQRRQNLCSDKAR